VHNVEAKLFYAAVLILYFIKFHQKGEKASDTIGGFCGKAFCDA
jgi:hypothetical protein